MSERLCIFCCHFTWTAGSVCRGSTETGPWLDDGDALCAKGHRFPHAVPRDQDEYRENIVVARDCRDYSRDKDIPR